MAMAAVVMVAAIVRDRGVELAAARVVARMKRILPHLAGTYPECLSVLVFCEL